MCCHSSKVKCISRHAREENVSIRQQSDQMFYSEGVNRSNDFTWGQLENSAVDDEFKYAAFFFFFKVHGVKSYTILFVAHNIIAVIS